MSGRKIEIQSPMRAAMFESIDAYRPTFRGKCLDVEASIPAVSLKNLNVLLDAGLEVCGLESGPGGVLVTFRSGETYLATGFAVNQTGEAVHLLIQFAVKACPGRREDWQAYLMKLLPDGYTGTIDIPPPCGEAIHAFG